MYYNGEIAAEIEEMLFDFLMYRKARRDKSYKMQSQGEIESGWKYYNWPEDAQLTEPEPQKQIAASLEEPASTSPKPVKEEPPIAKLSQQELSALMPETEMPQPSPMPVAEYHAAAHLGNTLPPPLNLRHDADVNDLNYMELLMGEINQRVLPMVRQILNDYEYEGSPVYDTVDKETLAQMVDKVLESAAGLLEETETLRFLRAMIETAILSELFYRRRPMYRRAHIQNIGL